MRAEQISFPKNYYLTCLITLHSKCLHLYSTLKYVFELCRSTSQFSSVAQSCLTLCDPMNCSTPGFPVHHQLLELGQTQVHRVGDAIQPSHPQSSPSPTDSSSWGWLNSSVFLTRTSFIKQLMQMIAMVSGQGGWVQSVCFP